MDSSTINNYKSTSDPISSGEVCTIASAKQLGIFDVTSTMNSLNGSSPTSYITGNLFKDLKTFNNKLDTINSQAKASLCFDQKVSSLDSKKNKVDKTNTYKHCSVEFGAGFDVNPEDKAACRLMTCPSDNNAYVYEDDASRVFVETEVYDPSQKKRVSTCKKPLIDAIVDKRSKCSERWYDWFTVPNYHLGNKFMTSTSGEDAKNAKDAKCYAPCPSYKVPFYNTDPVDSEQLGWWSTDDPSRCVFRDEYFFGKYKHGSDYCPLASLHQIIATPESLKQELLIQNSNQLNLIENNKASASSVYKSISSDGYMNTEADKIHSITQQNKLTNIVELHSDMQNACNTLNTPEHVEPAYNACKQLMDDEEEYLHNMNSTLQNNTLAKNKITVMKQACNAVFCNDNSTAMGAIGEAQKICFPTPLAQIDASGNIQTGDDIKDPEAPVPEQEKQFFKRSFAIAARLCLVIIILTILYILWTYIIYPYAVKGMLYALYEYLGYGRAITFKARDSLETMDKNSELQALRLRGKK